MFDPSTVTSFPLTDVLGKESVMTEHAYWAQFHDMHRFSSDAWDVRCAFICDAFQGYGYSREDISRILSWITQNDGCMTFYSVKDKSGREYLLCTRDEADRVIPVIGNARRKQVKEDEDFRVNLDSIVSECSPCLGFVFEEGSVFAFCD